MLLQGTALSGIDGNGAQQIGLGFLVSGAADVQPLDHLFLPAVFKVAEFQQIRPERIVLFIVGQPLFDGSLPLFVDRGARPLPGARCSACRVSLRC